MPLILDLCGGTGSWSDPYRMAGYEVFIVDPLRNFTVERFLYLVQSGELKFPTEVRGVLAAPPCTEFSSAGARHWASKDPRLLNSAIGTVRACIEVVTHFSPKWWALENPVGRIKTACPFLGKERLIFHPCEYGDPWRKQTWLFGNFTPPPKTHDCKGVDRSRIHSMSDQPGRATLRSITPPRFAEAFFRSNP